MKKTKEPKKSLLGFAVASAIALGTIDKLTENQVAFSEGCFNNKVETKIGFGVGLYGTYFCDSYYAQSYVNMGMVLSGMGLIAAPFSCGASTALGL